MTFHIKGIVVFIIIFYPITILPQMPDWRFFRDREGNTYFIDQTGKIRITKEKGYNYQPVSHLGIDYYLNYGIQLINDHHIAQGLTILKSILVLPVNNNRIRNAQVKASGVINNLKKIHGTRYYTYDRDASLLLIKKSDMVTVIDDRMLYSLLVEGDISVIRKRKRGADGYCYNGLLIGIRRKSTGNNRDGYDFLLAVDSEEYSVKIKDIHKSEELWKNKLGYDNLSRKKLSESSHSIIYAIASRVGPRLSGVEGIFINGRFHYYVRILSAGSVYDNNRVQIENVIKSFKTVSSAEGRRNRLY